MKTFIAALLISAGFFRLALATESVYTPLSGKSCSLESKDEETDTASYLCPGVGGYRLRVTSSDQRMSVEVLSPDGEAHDLDFQTAVTPHMSHLGKKAEWRVERKAGRVVPIGLIVEVDALEQEESEKVTPYLAVAKITASDICVTDSIPPSLTSAKKARIAADAAANQKCLLPINN